MSSFFDRIRSGAEQAAGKAAFEADKLRRVTALQGKLRALKNDFEKSIVETGQTAFALYQKEQIAGPETLRQACTQLAAIQAQIVAYEQEVEAIRAETFEEPQAKAQYGRVCPNGHGAILAQDNFCQVCGARAVEMLPPQGSTLCPNCGATLSSKARFCAECGQEVKQGSTPSGEICANCGALRLPDSVFCTECGHRSVIASTQSVPEDSTEEETTSHAFSEMAEADALLTETETVLDLLNGENLIVEQDEAEKPVSHQAEKTVSDTCPVCTASLGPDALFCTECGYQFRAGEGS
jgi:membrane protease subunit (stomatin/prohibitin family)